MIIITADDYGKTRHATDSILECFSEGRITSASAMVFMDDSERAGRRALEGNMEVGLHLNLSMQFTDDKVSRELRGHQRKVIGYLTRNKATQAIFNPLIANSVGLLVRSQQDEFLRLYGKPPAFYNGHHHMHLCANVLLGGMIPANAKIRRTFTFDRGEKNPLNRLYRYFLDARISAQYCSTDSFFSVVPVSNQARLRRIFDRAASNTVEVEVHPENSEEKEFLLSEEFRHLMHSVRAGNFRELPVRA